MTGKVFLICGKICSGKSFYAEKLGKEKNAVLLSVDELMLLLFGPYLGDKHDEISGKTQKYLFEKSAEIAKAGCNVILDWGFWRSKGRKYAREFYAERNIPCEFHYIDISDEMWQENIAGRNKAVAEGKTSAYPVDDNLKAKLMSLFETPERSEIDVWYENRRSDITDFGE